MIKAAEIGHLLRSTILHDVATDNTFSRHQNVGEFFQVELWCKVETAQTFAHIYAHATQQGQGGTKRNKLAMRDYGDAGGLSMHLAQHSSTPPGAERGRVVRFCGAWTVGTEFRTCGNSRNTVEPSFPSIVRARYYMVCRSMTNRRVAARGSAWQRVAARGSA